MKLFMFLLVFLHVGSSDGKPIPGLTEIRSLYDESAKNKAAAEQLHKLLSEVNDQSAPVLVCYKGVAEMIQAKYVFSPVSKWSSFKKGKKLIEASLLRDTAGIEMRYLRFTIQTNLPGFLGYKHNIEEDKKFLLNRLDNINDRTLKLNVVKYLSASEYCSEEERKMLRQ